MQFGVFVFSVFIREAARKNLMEFPRLPFQSDLLILLVHVFELFFHLDLLEARDLKNTKWKITTQKIVVYFSLPPPTR